MQELDEIQNNPADPPSALKAIKEWLTFGAAIVVAVSGIIFWVQNASNTKIEHIERDISALRIDMKEIQAQNGVILRLVGKLEGKLDGLQRR